MTIYEKNLESIKNNGRYTYMYRFIDKLLIDNNSQIEYIESIDSKEAGKSLFIRKAGKTYRLGSSFNPLFEAEKWAEQFKLKDIGIVISMFGFGNGTIPRALIKRMKKDEKIIFYEPSKEIFLHVLENYDITDLVGDFRVYFVVEGLNDEDFFRILTYNIDETNVYSQVICIHPKYDELFADGKMTFYNVIKKSKGNARVNQNAKSYLASISTFNVINNIRFVNKNNTLYELIRLFTPYKDIPVIIVSAGPSLDKNIEKLRRAKGKSVIISVDTAIESLLAKDIIPDFTIIMDPIKAPETYQDKRALSIPIIIRSESNYNITKKHIGQKFFVDAHVFYDYLYNILKIRMPQLTSGGSVSTMAFSLCLSIGFEFIILVGQDLSYVGDFTHVGGQMIDTNNDMSDIYVEGINGDMVKTRNDWYQYLIWFDNAVDAAKFKGCQIIDATEGGAKIKGTEIMTLNEVIDLYCHKKIDIDNILSTLSGDSDNNEIEIIKEYINQSILDLDIIKQKSNESIEICNKLIELCEQDGDIDIISKCDNKLRENNHIMSSLYINNLLDEYITTEVRRAIATIYKIEDDIKKEKIRTYEIAKKIYKANLKACDDIKKMLYELIE